jgi:hypothetical protein
LRKFGLHLADSAFAGKKSRVSRQHFIIAQFRQRKTVGNAFLPVAEACKPSNDLSPPSANFP